MAKNDCVCVRETVCEQFQYLDLAEIQKLTDPTPEELKDSMEMSATKPVPDDEEEDEEAAVPENTDLRQSGRRILVTHDYF